MALASIGTQTVAESLLSLSCEERIAPIALEAFSNLPPAVAMPVFQIYFFRATTAERRKILRQLGIAQRKIVEEFGTASGETLVQCASIALRSAEDELFGMALQLLEDARLDSAADCLAEFALSEALQDRRSEAILALGGFRTKRATKLLERFLDNDEEWVRESAVKALRELLLRRRRTPEDDQVRQMAAEMLVATEDRSPETLELLRDLTRDSDEWIRSLVLQSLDRFFELDQLLDILRGLLLSPRRLTPEDDQMRQMAAEILVATEDRSPETLELLRDLTRDSDERIRSLVLQSLDRFYNSKELPDV